METHGDIVDDVLRAKAIAFLQEILRQNRGRSSYDVATCLTELAYGENNPVKDLFAASVTGTAIDSNSTSEATPSTTIPAKSHSTSQKDPLKPRRSRSLLRLGRSSKQSLPDDKAGPSKHDESWPPSAGTLKLVRSLSKSGLNSLHSAAPPQSTKASTSTPYRCIICNELLSSKGVCKRHLEDQHVSPTRYRCELCDEMFNLKAEAKEHVKMCGAGVFSYAKAKQPEKRHYACEFTGQAFPSMARYLEHLLNLSGRTENRPSADAHKKFYAVLQRPDLLPHVEEISQRLYGSIAAWRRLRWDTERLKAETEMLEYAVVYPDGRLEPGKRTKTPQMVHHIQQYMYALLSSGSQRPSSTGTVRHLRTDTDEPLPRSYPASNGSDGTLTPRMAKVKPMSPEPPLPTSTYHEPWMTTSQPRYSTIPAPEQVSQPPPMYPTPLMDPDTKGKRHLSDQSRFYEPIRHPPGPPSSSSLSSIQDSSLPSSGHTTPDHDFTDHPAYRPPDQTTMQMTTLPFDSHPQHMYTPSLGTSVSSDAASEHTTSGIMSNFRELELTTPVRFEDPWQNTPGAMMYSLDNSSMPTYQALPGYTFGMHGNASRTPSMTTDQTFVDYSGADQKHMSISAASVNSMRSVGTSWFDDADQGEDYYSYPSG